MNATTPDRATLKRGRAPIRGRRTVRRAPTEHARTPCAWKAGRAVRAAPAAPAVAAVAALAAAAAAALAVAAVAAPVEATPGPAARARPRAAAAAAWPDPMTMTPRPRPRWPDWLWRLSPGRAAAAIASRLYHSPTPR